MRKITENLKRVEQQIIGLDRWCYKLYEDAPVLGITFFLYFVYPFINSAEAIFLNQSN